MGNETSGSAAGSPDEHRTDYPLTLRMAGRSVVVVGGGRVALRRVTGLLATGAVVRVVAPDLSASLTDLARAGRLAVEQRPYRSGDLAGAWLAHACTDRPEVNDLVAREAEAGQIWCVRADLAAESAAWVPAVGRTGAVTVAVTSGGDPRRSVDLRDRLLAWLPSVLPALPVARGAAPSTRTGRVAIVGGGPGDPGLITRRGHELLSAADVVVVDRLAPLGLLDALSSDVLVVDAAKVPGGPSMQQEMINQVLVSHALDGRDVVRLKGGDPFVFGRGHEELQACVSAGLDVEVVPGVSSAVAVPGAAGIPVTHRGVSQGFTVVSGHVPPGDPRSSVDWSALARCGTTLVLLMAVDTLPEIARALVAGGLDAATQAAAIMSGATDRQQVVTAPLSEIADRMRAASISNPAVIVIGDVVGQREALVRAAGSVAGGPERTGGTRPGHEG